MELFMELPVHCSRYQVIFGLALLTLVGVSSDVEDILGPSVLEECSVMGTGESNCGVEKEDLRRFA
jgi:hypothetical protein